MAFGEPIEGHHGPSFFSTRGVPRELSVIPTAPIDARPQPGMRITADLAEYFEEIGGRYFRPSTAASPISNQR